MGHKYTKIVGTEAPQEACLFLGSIDWVIEDEILDDLQIRAILSVLPKQPQYADEVLKSHGIPEDDYMVYPLEDSSDEYISLFDAPGVVTACEFIHGKRLEGKNVLVHCDAGITRSPAVVVSYLMKYGTNLCSPRQVSLEDAIAIVRGLRERMDICAFHAELVRLQSLLERGEVPCNPIDVVRNLSFPRTPLSPKEWGTMQEEGDPWVELGLLHSTWAAIRSLDGGQETFGRAVYKNVFALGGRRMEDMYAEVDMQRLSAVMTAMLRKMIWCLDAHNMEHLVKFHRHLDIITDDFETFHRSIIVALKDVIHMSDDALASWDRFLQVVFNRWARAIDQPPLKSEYPASPSPSATPTTKLEIGVTSGGCPFAARASGLLSDAVVRPKLALPSNGVK